MTIPCQRRFKLFSTLLVAIGLGLPSRADDAPAAKPIEALMISGGCCHDYPRQQVVLSQGITARANVHWTIFYEDGPKDHQLSIYSNPDFWKGYDLILYNDCYDAVTDPTYVAKTLAPHLAGIPAVVLHCALFDFIEIYRAGKTDDWLEFTGMTAVTHGGGNPLTVKVLQPQNPIMIGFPADWVTDKEELYQVSNVLPTVQPLAEGFQVDVEDYGDAGDASHPFPVIWTNLYHGKTRVFGTTMAHATQTMEDPVYLSLVTRGLLWACDKLDDKGRPKPGYGPQPSPPPPTILPPAPTPPPAAKN